MSQKRQSLLGRSGVLREVPVTMEGSDGPVELLVRELSGKDAAEFEQAVARNSPTSLGMVLQLSLVDPETHELVFGPADRGALQELGISALKPVLAAIQDLSGLTEADLEKAKRSLGLGPSSDSNW